MAASFHLRAMTDTNSSLHGNVGASVMLANCSFTNNTTASLLHFLYLFSSSFHEQRRVIFVVICLSPCRPTVDRPSGNIAHRLSVVRKGESQSRDLLHLISKMMIIHNPKMIIHTTWELIMHNRPKRVPILVGAPPFLLIQWCTYYL